MRIDIAETPLGAVRPAPERQAWRGMAAFDWSRLRPGPLTIGTAMLWLVAYVNLMSYSLTMASEAPTLDLALRRAIFCVCCAGMCGLVYAVLDRTRALATGWRYATAGLLILLACVAYHYLFGLLFFILWPIFHEPFNWTVASVLTIFTGAIWYFLSSVILYFAVSYGAEARANERRLAESQRLALDSQNRMLRYQINPHFLFNSLNALSSLVVYKESERADEMLQSLSSFLRYSLDKNPDDKVALAEELDAQRQYLRIEQIRFGERLVITVRDNGAPAVPGELKPGVGLRNVRRRLEVIYGAAGKFEYHRREPRGFEVTLSLPLETK